MRRIVVFLLALLSCGNLSGQVDKTTVADAIVQTKEPDYSQYHTQQDTILIATEIGDTLRYAKADFNDIVDSHPEFFGKYPDHPDQAYLNNYEGFGSEFEQDDYYILYAYFLKQTNGVEEFARQRQALIDIYLGINSLFQYFKHGGTYFGHQCRRILGYAEYSVYLLPKGEGEFAETYDIAKQKGLYIKSLRQLIEDESAIDFETQGQEKSARKKELDRIVDELDRLITDKFYLGRAQAFHYGYYEYY